MNKRKVFAILLVLAILTSVIVPVAARYVTGGRRINGPQILSDAIDSRHYNDDSIDDAHINWGTGTNQVSAVDINLSDCAAITSTGTITSSGTFDATGAVGMTFGSVDITSMTFTTDGTGNAEFTFPNDIIGDADIDLGTGAGQLSGTDLTLTDCAAVTSTGTITSSGVFDATGAVAMTLGSVDITSMTFITDGTGNAEFTFPADVVGEADIDWGAGSGQVSGVDITLTDCGAVTSTGTITSSGTFDVTGANSMVLGSVDVTDMTFTTDGTGNAEFTFPNDIIGDADIDWGAGAGQVSGADITYAEGDMTDSTIISADIKDGTVAVGDLAVPKYGSSTSQTLLYNAFTDNTDATGYIDFTTDQVPAGAIPLGFKAVVTTGFTGNTTAVIEVGVAGDTDRFSSVTDQSVLAAATVGAGAATDAADGMNAAQTIRVTVTGATDFTTISAGNMTVYVYWLATA